MITSGLYAYTPCVIEYGTSMPADATVLSVRLSVYADSLARIAIAPGPGRRTLSLALPLEADLALRACTVTGTTVRHITHDSNAFVSTLPLPITQTRVR